MEESEEDDGETDIVSREVIVIAAVIIVAIAASFLFLGLSDVLNGQSPGETEVTVNSNPNQKTVTVTLVSLGDSDHIAVLGFEEYGDEGDVPYLNEPGKEAIFDFSESSTEDSGTLRVVSVDGEIEDSGRMDTKYGSGVHLGEIGDGANQTFVRSHSFDFSE